MILLTELIKQLKREYKSGGEVKIEKITITPEGKVVIGGTFESGPTRTDAPTISPRQIASKKGENPYEAD